MKLYYNDREKPAAPLFNKPLEDELIKRWNNGDRFQYVEFVTNVVPISSIAMGFTRKMVRPTVKAAGRTLHGQLNLCIFLLRVVLATRAVL